MGLFGDSYGAVNSLFSGLAFAGIIYTIILQKKELSLQRDELMQTRIELQRSANAQEKSEKALIQQIDAMSSTAKLNAWKTLVDHYKEEYENRPRGMGIENRPKDQKLVYIKKIEHELKKLGDT